MVKSYTKYEQSNAFGVVTSGSSNIVWSADESAQNRNGLQTSTGLTFVGANEDVLCWDLKKGDLISRWHDSGCKSEVTVIAQSKTDKDIFAVGYDDGSIRLWDSRMGSQLITFNGHKSAVTSLAFDLSGVRLASGSKDTDIIIWDLVAETGAFKLRGHKDQVVSLHFIIPKASADEEEDQAALNDDATGGYILSASKDALIKLWDLSSQHCIETHVSQSNGGCSAMGLSADGNACITAGSEGELKVWLIDQAGLREASRNVQDSTGKSFIHDRGTLRRYEKDRAVGVSFHPRSNYIAIHGSEKAVEIWRMRSEEEVIKVLARKRRRAREKALVEGKEEDALKDVATAQLTDLFVLHVIVRPSGKVRSCDWMNVRSSNAIQLAVATRNNLVETFSISTKEKSKKGKTEDEPNYDRTHSVDLPGHRADVRALTLSSDDRMLASASNGGLKIWNVQTRNCLRTLECGYALCAAFLPGDKIVVVGTKSGELELFDIATATLIERFQGHENAVWTLQVHPDGRSLVTGGADKTAKFWNFEIVQEEIPGTRRTTPRLKLVHKRTLKVNDDVLSVRFTPDARLLAVATLDNTVKVFFVDSLKLFLTLYGHKLPVLNMSISSDSKIIATCSADKNVRLWGLDFGDCHKAFFAHNDSILNVAFIPHPVSKEDAHFFFSASKDRLIKTWDGDKFEHVQKLDGHAGEIWAMAVSRTGDFLVTASHDKSLRIWSQSDEPIFLEEEREKELEDLYESTLEANLADDVDGDAGDKSEVAAASKQTVATLTAGERIAEALELGYADLQLVNEWTAQKATNPKLAPPARDPLFLALNQISAEKHVLNTIMRIPAAQLQDALLVLPFATVGPLFTFVGIWLRRQWATGIACRVLFFMLRTHQRQVVASRELKGMLEAMRGDLGRTLGIAKDVMGFNRAALGFVAERVREKGERRIEDVEAADESKGRRKRAFVDVG
ncbi:F-box/WD repeat-containing protein pof1 [Eremomyces bilateralis CBS 781.70]|uniref:F-box/WD repeat-containing protein pof1 n=1 Tax=Eremomyces bilateralis CBS 781.70 TaxID=1392243 RepID=A0A6G1FXW1_9PEZI|nr:F-box/WD repeat-containing protein pof1 [Eremomyces bilateralis CBS 781.70]KAF1810677.1 F-box/WD repeat-containing protein pof1 [Eremomyces bilateralis CBS 781.70]